MLKTAAPVSANIDASPRLIDVEDDFMVIPSCRSSDIAVSERLRRAHGRVSAVTHEAVLWGAIQSRPDRNWRGTWRESAGLKITSPASPQKVFDKPE
jgi:hypothetical protein